MHTIILPYFCEAEIDRYERILEHIGRLGSAQCQFEFLLAASPRIAPSERLMKAAARVAASRHFSCPSPVFGYPQGPSAMFWDCMSHLAEQRRHSGFALWMESDMCPIKAGWLDQLDHDWHCCGDVYAMGCVVPQVNRHQRRFPLAGRGYRHEPWVPQHINGGACYCLDLVRHMPADFREGLFDVRLGEILNELGGYADTPAIRFSTLERVQQDLADPHKVLLHGYLQDKDSFLSACMGQAPSRGHEAANVPVLRSDAWGWRSQHPAQPKLDAVLSIKDRQPSVLTVYQRRAAAARLAA
jgi:hypothetical protein